MLPMRISATTLESFRLFMEPDNDWMLENELLATIRGEFVPTADILRGLAWGKVLESPTKYAVHSKGDGRLLGYAYTDRYGNPWQFSAETMARPLALLDHARGVFEAKAEKTYLGGDAVVVSKADYLLGLHMREFKCTTKAFDADKYLASCQWRLMADAFEPAVITYDIFVVDDHENGVVELKDIHSMNVYPYPALTEDCERLVSDFVDYVRLRGLDGLLRDRQRKVLAAATDIFAGA